jgi:transposase InsO family protein
VGLKRTDEFRQDAVRIALTSGLTADNHTDRRSQYYSNDYQKILRQNGFKVSMSGKDNCYEFKDGLRSR